MDMLIERVTGEDLRARLDRAGRRIRDIAMLRSESKNGYRYSPAAMQAAARLFEGAPAYLDHPAQAATGTAGRAGATGLAGGHSVRDLIGRFTQVRLQGDLVRGDLHLLPGPEGDKVLALAEEMPSAVGFSIEAQGILTQQNGEKVVTELTAARGVALVTEPAATRGLFESRQLKVVGPAPKKSPADSAYAPPSLAEQVDALRAEDPELYQAVVLAEDRRRETIRAAARRQRLTLSESTVARLAGHGSLEQGLQLLEALAADLRSERAGERAGGVQTLPARAGDRMSQLETELNQRLVEAE